MEIEELKFHEPRQALAHELAEGVTVVAAKSLRR